MNNRGIQYAKLFKIASKRMEYYCLKGIDDQADICDKIKYESLKNYIEKTRYIINFEKEKRRREQ